MVRFCFQRSWLPVRRCSGLPILIMINMAARFWEFQYWVMIQLFSNTNRKI